MNIMWKYESENVELNMNNVMVNGKALYKFICDHIKSHGPVLLG